MKRLRARTSVEFLATRTCPQCGQAVGAIAARKAEERRAEFVATAHRRVPGLTMTAWFERGPIPLRCAGCGALVALDSWSPELTLMTDRDAAVFVAEVEGGVP